MVAALLALAAAEGLAFDRTHLAVEGPKPPVLMVEAGMHTGWVQGVAVDTKGRIAVTVSTDKSARIWDLRSKQLMRVIRPFPGTSAEAGQLIACAISSDSSRLALGGVSSVDKNGMPEGPTEAHIYEIATGRLIQRIPGRGAFVSLAFSRDGERLIAGDVWSSQDKSRVRSIELRSGKVLWSDSKLKGWIYQVSLDPRERTVICSLGGTIRLYSRAGIVLASRELRGLSPYKATFNHDGSLIALGFVSSKPLIRVIDGTNLRDRYLPSTMGLSGSLANVCWSRDGMWLYASGSSRDSSGRTLVRRWTNGGRGAFSDAHSSRQSIQAIVPDASGGIVFGSDDGWGTIDRSFKLGFERLPTADYHAVRAGFRVSDLGDLVRFEYGPQSSAGAWFSLPDRAVALTEPGLPFGGTGNLPRTVADGLSVSGWRDTSQPKVNGRIVQLMKGEVSTCAAVAPATQSVVLGTSFLLRCLDTQGRSRWVIWSAGAVCAVNTAANGQLVLAAFDDGTIRWYRMSDGAELLAFFPHADKRRWIAWTPSGYYDCSPGAEDLIGWYVPRGPGREGDFFTASQFRDTYYRPDIVRTIVSTLDESRAVQKANDITHLGQPAPISGVLPPVVRMISASTSGDESRPALKVVYGLRTPSGEPASHVDIYVDGRLAQSEDLRIVARDEVRREVTLQLGSPPSLVAVQAWNRFAPSIIERWKLGGKSVEVDQPGERQQKVRRLWVLSIGIEGYDNVPKLQYARDDAVLFAQSLSDQKSSYAEVKSKLIEDATADQIRDGFDWLRGDGDLLGMSNGDVAMIFLSGHGVQEADLSYHFLARDFDISHRSRTSVAFSELLGWLGSLRPRGTVFAFIDTCHAGAALGSMDSTGLVQRFVSPEVGAIAFSACSGNQRALEGAEWGGGHGAFTYYLVEGLKGGAADETGLVSPTGLAEFLRRRFQTDSRLKNRQTPAFNSGGQVSLGDLYVTRVRQLVRAKTAVSSETAVLRKEPIR